MTRRRLQKGTNPLSVGGGIRKANKKCIDQNQRGDTELKSVGADRGKIKPSTRHRQYTRRQTQQMMDSRGARKRAPKKWSIAILPFCEEDISASVFHHFTM